MAGEATAAKSTQELRVFISYSRADLAFVDRLDLAFTATRHHTHH